MKHPLFVTYSVLAILNMVNWLWFKKIYCKNKSYIAANRGAKRKKLFLGFKDGRASRERASEESIPKMNHLLESTPSDNKLCVQYFQCN